MSDPVLDIFAEAVDLAPEERSRHLDRACGGNLELRRKVESLLTQDDAAGANFLPLPPPNPNLDRLFEKPDGPDGLVGKTIGAYTIRAPIASGGMGTVYRAEQANPRRDVALKILHGGFGAALRRRFEHEAQILALLRHPHIAQVYEAGTATVDTDGGHSRRVSFFAMEYVPGAASITQYAEALKLSLRRKLELFAEVCDAIHHGHQRGIVHRDLKPANILVDEMGVTKVVDFGVARVTDSDVAVTTMQTDAGQLIGTLAYMSPEQCAADPREIHTPSDVYSLGVVLFELLTGRLPYDVSHLTIHAAARMICEQSPAPPSQFDRHLKGDVETIVIKAMEKDKAKRYASASALADDIRRYLKGEPIAARPPTRFTKVIGWVRRRPVLATVLTCLGLLSTTGIATYLLVYYLSFAPDQLIMRVNGIPTDRRPTGTSADDAVLVAYGRRPLFTWGKRMGSIHDALLFDRHSPWNDKVALISFGREEPFFQSEFAIFHADRPEDAPVKRDKIRTPDDLPGIEKKNDPSRWDFSPNAIRHLDIFPDDVSPGEEFIVVFAGTHSMRCLRIYRQDGTLLYNIWHDGGICDMRWLSKPGLLVILGQDDTAKQLLNDATRKTIHTVYVLFALVPTLDPNVNEVTMSCPDFGTVKPRWIRYFHPPVIDTSYDVILRDTTGDFADDEHVSVQVGGKGDANTPGRITFHSIVDGEGHEVPKTRNLGDSKSNPNSKELMEIQLRDVRPTIAD